MGPSPCPSLNQGWGLLFMGSRMFASRSFPRPWCIVEIPGGFYWWNDPNALHPLEDVLTIDEARSMAVEFANLPEP
jgi:hypothetical protein